MPVTETVTDPGPKANEMVGGVGGAWFGGRGAGAAVVTAAGAVGARVGEAAAPGRGGGELGASEGRLASTWLHPHIARRTANPTVAGNLTTAFLPCVLRRKVTRAARSRPPSTLPLTTADVRATLQCEPSDGPHKSCRSRLNPGYDVPAHRTHRSDGKDLLLARSH